MVHDRITHKRAIQNVVRTLIGFRTDLADEFCDSGPHRFTHLLLGTRMHHHVRDPTHEILAKADLGIHPSC